MTGTAMAPQDWTLLVLNAAGGDKLTPVHLQKCLYLLKRNVVDHIGGDFYEFAHHHYGAFCLDIYNDCRSLTVQGDAFGICETGQRWTDYAISPKGSKRATEIESNLDPRITAYLHTMVNWAKSLDFEQIVNAVYEAFPETKENSIFRAIEQ